MKISELKPGDKHYMAYVGPPTLYDIMGATQFRLLSTLGLRSNHYLLDFGCGSLRAGRLFINYLNKGRYFGIDPNQWLIEEAINNQIGKDILNLKNPSFDHNAKFATDIFSQKFDFIIAQSVFSHTGNELIRKGLLNFKESLRPGGLIVATFVEDNSDYDGNGWIYPDCVGYRPSAIEKFAEEVGLFTIRIPWYHREQTWYLFSSERKRLPNKSMLRYLKGAILFDPEFSISWERDGMIYKLVEFMKRILPQPVKNTLKALIQKIGKNS